jgi:hypothetical protein
MLQRGVREPSLAYSFDFFLFIQTFVAHKANSYRSRTSWSTSPALSKALHLCGRTMFALRTRSFVSLLLLALVLMAALVQPSMSRELMKKKNKGKKPSKSSKTALTAAQVQAGGYVIVGKVRPIGSRST